MVDGAPFSDKRGAAPARGQRRGPLLPSSADSFVAQYLGGCGRGAPWLEIVTAYPLPVPAGSSALCEGVRTTNTIYAIIFILCVAALVTAAFLLVTALT